MIEDDNDGGNEANKGWTEAAENGGGENVALIEIAGSFHRPPSGIHITSHLSHICSEAELQEVTVLASESEAAEEEEEAVEVEDIWRFFRP